jgi:UDP-2,4-diacetamido-2,4,6-trideoxy-beta-L-altropyranose hydrolase
MTASAARDSAEVPLLTILADGGRDAGFGHVGRCLAIWEELDGQATFAVQDALLRRKLEALEAPIADPGLSTPLLLVDRRRPTGAAEVAGMQARGARVCLLDDPGEGRASADLLVDPPTGSAWPSTRAPRLAGFEHVLLRRDVRRATRRPSAGIDVLISMGASDPEGLTPALATALRAADISVLAVLGPLYHGARPDCDVLDDPQEWPQALAGANLLVGRFGHTLLEAAHLGTPTLAIASSEPALREATAFATHGTAEAIRMDGPADAAGVVERVLALLGDPARLTAMSRRGRQLVDGHGAARVAAALLELA